MASDPTGIPSGDAPVSGRRSSIDIFRPLAWGVAVLSVVAAMGALVAPPVSQPITRSRSRPTPSIQPATDLSNSLAESSKEGDFGQIPALALSETLQAEWDAEGPFGLTRGSPTLPYISLTFDGDTHSGDVVHILKVLSRAGIPATFFLTGDFIEKYPDTVRAIGAAGHEVGSHLYRHVHLTTWEQNRRHELLPGVSRADLHDLLRRNEDVFRKVTGREMVRLWRAPFGETNPVLNAWAAELGYVHVAWTRDRDRDKSMDSLDWVADLNEPRYLTAAQIRERLLSFDGGRPGGANGAIVLMHTGSQRREEPAWTILDEFITGMVGRGYRFVAVSRLIGLGLNAGDRTAAGDRERAP